MLARVALSFGTMIFEFQIRNTRSFMKPFTGVLFITGWMSCALASRAALQPAPLFLISMECI
jgi:uncharacterized membrane protein YgdD (TMEM256/DUF423 family)